MRPFKSMIPAMFKRHAVVLLVAVSANVLLGCGTSEPRNADSEPKKTEKTSQGKKTSKPQKEGKAEVARPLPNTTVRASQLVGPWLMTMPKGAKREVAIRPAAENRINLDKAGRFAGVYELQQGRLTMLKPTMRDETGFVWEVRGPDQLDLVEQRPGLESSYVGATLTRLKEGKASDDNAQKPLK